MNTNLRRTLVLGLMSAALSGSVFAQQDEKLGKLTFPTSCDPKVQADFRARRGYAAFVLVSVCTQDIRECSATGSQLRNRPLGNRG